MNKPQRAGKIIKSLIITPRKPNSAMRKVCKVALTQKKNIFAKVPGEGKPLQKFSLILIRGHGHRDTPNVKYSVIRGAKECPILFYKRSKRSKYGTKKPFFLFTSKRSKFK